MYNYIKGTLAAVEAGKVVLENNGIGYELGVSGNTLADAKEIGREMKLYTYLYVREDVFALYGFSRAEEKTLFMRLIEISGVGPKLAMQILGGYDLGTLTVAIAASEIGGAMDEDVSDAVFALVSLGVSNTEAVRAVQKAKETAKGVQELISTALKFIG